jgi:hypothetical protein
MCCSSAGTHIRWTEPLGFDPTTLNLDRRVDILVAIVRKRLMLTISLYQILQILSVTLFEKTPILQALQPSDSQETLLDNSNQLNLSNL